MDFKETKSFNYGRKIGIIYTPIALFLFYIVAANIKPLSVGTNILDVYGLIISGIVIGISPILVIISIILILVIISIILLIKDCKKYGTLECSNMNILDWIFYSLVYLFPLLILFSNNN